LTTEKFTDVGYIQRDKSLFFYTYCNAGEIKVLNVSINIGMSCRFLVSESTVSAIMSCHIVNIGIIWVISATLISDINIGIGRYFKP